MSFKSRSTLTSKGQITLPVELRRRWDLKPGDCVDFCLEDDGRVVFANGSAARFWKGVSFFPRFPGRQKGPKTATNRAQKPAKSGYDRARCRNPVAAL